MPTHEIKKSKTSKKIELLEADLFNKLSEIKKDEEKARDNTFQAMQSHNDSLTELISKAKNIVHY